jgi:predicted dehydrogenase
MTLKVAIIGCGKIADAHIEEIQKMPAAARIVAVADLELLIAEQIASRYGIAAHYDDVDRLLANERPDVVHITTPPNSHLPLAMKAVDAGAHVYVEKPLALTFADSQRLVDYVERSGKKLTIGYSYYYDPTVSALRDLHDRGALGDVVHVESFLGYSLSGPFGRAILADPNHWVHRMPGKLFQNNLDHVLFELPRFLGLSTPSSPERAADPLGGVKISASGWIRRSQRFADVRDDMLDELRVTLTTPTASAFAWFSSHAKPTGQFTRVYGTRDTAQVLRELSTLTVSSPPRLPSAIGRLTPAFEQGIQFLREGVTNVSRFARSEFQYFAGMRLLIDLFYDSILKDGPPPIPYRDILLTSAWMDEIWRQVPQDGTRS